MDKSSIIHYPFGMLMPGRTYSSSTYRYGFNGMERENSIKGEGNSYSTEYRQLDVRLGRWLTMDPIFHPSLSPYCSFDNNPTNLIDPYGLSSSPPGGKIRGLFRKIGDVFKVSRYGGLSRGSTKEKDKPLPTPGPKKSLQPIPNPNLKIPSAKTPQLPNPAPTSQSPCCSESASYSKLKYRSNSFDQEIPVGGEFSYSNSYGNIKTTADIERIKQLCGAYILPDPPPSAYTSMPKIEAKIDNFTLTETEEGVLTNYTTLEIRVTGPKSMTAVGLRMAQTQSAVIQRYNNINVTYSYLELIPGSPDYTTRLSTKWTLVTWQTYEYREKIAKKCDESSTPCR